MGVPIIEPNTPPLDTVNVPPVMSSIAIWSERAFFATSASASSMPARPRPSMLRSTGTTRPRGLDTATEMST